MADELIIDAHVHTYPTAEIGRQAMAGFGQSGSEGTVPEILEVMTRGKISCSLMANMTPTYDMKTALLKNLAADQKEKAEQEINAKVIARLKRRNLWSCNLAKDNPALVPLISVDIFQTPADMEAEIKDKVGLGAKGLKFHPVANRFSADDRRMWPAYAVAMKEGLPILFHSGELEMVDQAARDYGRPKSFEAILQSFPTLTVILAHMARGFLDESTALAEKYDHLYFDISAIISSYEKKGGFTSDGHTVKVIRDIGAERILFGSDWPWYDPLPAIDRINRLDLTAEEKRKILGQNAARIFGLEKL